MDCRPYFEPEIAPLGLGNYTAGISQDEQVNSDTTFWDLARSVSTSTEKQLEKLKQFTELPVLNMLFGQVRFPAGVEDLSLVLPEWHGQIF